MSLWTPGGEHPVDRSRPAEPASSPAAGATGPVGPEGDPFADMSPEERERAEQMMAEMGEVRRQLSEAPAAAVVANHAMGLYELAAIHLTGQPPKLGEAKLAIDAFAALVEVLKGKLGQDEVTLTDGLQQLRLGYVQLAAAAGGEPAPGAAGAADAPGS
jgi:hypothetical protein